jgi:zinc transporter
MEDNGLIHACLFDGKGGARLLGWDEINAWTPDDGRLWIHLSYASTEAITWLREESGLEPLIVEALLSEETRPRSTVIGEGILMTLRGVNLNPGADVTDMVSLRIWAEEQRIITTRKRRLFSVTELIEKFAAGMGPSTSSQFIHAVNDLLTSYIEETVEKIEDRASSLEELIMTAHDGKLRVQISAIRRQAILLRRYLAPQREAIIRLHLENVSWFTERDKSHLYEIANNLIRIVEDLDSLRDRANVAQEELVNILSEQLNSRMYMLSLITAIFLPLSFLTGLLGINVSGIPGANSRWAFLIVIMLLLAVCSGQFVYFHKKKWI